MYMSMYTAWHALGGTSSPEGRWLNHILKITTKLPDAAQWPEICSVEAFVWSCNSV